MTSAQIDEDGLAQSMSFSSVYGTVELARDRVTWRSPHACLLALNPWNSGQ